MTKDEALKLALEHFETWSHEDSIFAGEFDKEITAIKEALAQPEQELVATWENKYGMKEWEVHALRAGWSLTPPQRTWVGLTDEEVESLQRLAIDPVDANGWGFLNRERYANLIEAALKAKNT